jgi:acetyl-CoA synthetase
VLHPKVAEAAVVGMPHDIKGQGIYAYVTLNAGERPSDDALRKALVKWVRTEIGPIATPDALQFAPGPAQDPLGQDHAPHPAQDRRGRRERALGDTSRSPIRRWSTIWWRTGQVLG